MEKEFDSEPIYNKKFLKSKRKKKQTKKKYYGDETPDFHDKKSCFLVSVLLISI